MGLLPDWLTGYDSANADAAAQADAQLQNQNQALYGPGGKYYSAANWAAVNGDYATQAPIGQDAQTAAIDQTFTDTLTGEANAIVGTPAGIFWAEVKALLQAVPWWVWVGAGVGVFVWLGGLKLLRGILGK